jgi:hypothetical protein
LSVLSFGYLSMELNHLQSGGLLVSVFSFCLAMLSLYIARQSWLQANRPLVTVRVATVSGGNSAIALKIVVENTGNRPAKNIRLEVDRNALKKLYGESADQGAVRNIEMIFDERGVIPILANGKSVSNSFGFLGEEKQQPVWKEEARIEIAVFYEDLDGRKFKYRNPILIADDEGFAGSFWDKSG